MRALVFFLMLVATRDAYAKRSCEGQTGRALDRCRIDQLFSHIEDLEARLAVAEARVEAHEEPFGLMRVERGATGAPTLLLEGANLWVRSLNGTDQAGNLVVGRGHQLEGANDALVAGHRHRARGSGVALVGGSGNEAGGTGVVVVGGELNRGEGTVSVIVGGESNSASGERCVVAGGEANSCRGVLASMFGGRDNVTTGLGSVAAGGTANKVDGADALALGGRENEAIGDGTVVQGGVRNHVRGAFAASLGGMENKVDGIVGVSVAGRDNRVDAQSTLSLGGVGNALRDPHVLAAGGTSVEGTDAQHVYIAGRDVSKPAPVVVEQVTMTNDGPRLAAVARAGTLIERIGSLAELTVGMRLEHGALGLDLRAGALHHLNERIYGFSLAARADVPLFTDELRLFVEPAFRNVAVTYGDARAKPFQHIGGALGISYRLLGTEQSTHRWVLSLGAHGGAVRREVSTIDALRERITRELRPELGFVMTMGWEVLP